MKKTDSDVLFRKESEEKCKQPRLGFELRSPIQIPTTIT